MSPITVKIDQGPKKFVKPEFLSNLSLNKSPKSHFRSILTPFCPKNCPQNIFLKILVALLIYLI